MNRVCLGFLTLLTFGCASAPTSKSAPESSAPVAPTATAQTKNLEKAPGYPDEIQQTDDCGMTAEDFLGEDQQTLVQCPVGCTRHQVTGTDVYPTSTPACVAAVHAGVLPFEGGLVLLTRTEGLSAYKASEQNQIHSAASGHYPAAFSMRGVDEEGWLQLPAQP